MEIVPRFSLLKQFDPIPISQREFSYDHALKSYD